MTGKKIILVGDSNVTGVRIAEDTGTAPPYDPNSTHTITFGVFSDSSVPRMPDRDEEDAKAEEIEKGRVKKMREGWKNIRKKHEYRG